MYLSINYVLKCFCKYRSEYSCIQVIVVFRRISVVGRGGSGRGYVIRIFSSVIFYFRQISVSGCRVFLFLIVSGVVSVLVLFFRLRSGFLLNMVRSLNCSFLFIQFFRVFIAVGEFYNFVLIIYVIMEYLNFVFIVDNEVIYDICCYNLDVKRSNNINFIGLLVRLCFLLSFFCVFTGFLTWILLSFRLVWCFFFVFIFFW